MLDRPFVLIGSRQNGVLSPRPNEPEKSRERSGRAPRARSRDSFYASGTPGTAPRRKRSKVRMMNLPGYVFQAVHRCWPGHCARQTAERPYGHAKEFCYPAIRCVERHVLGNLALPTIAVRRSPPCRIKALPAFRWRIQSSAPPQWRRLGRPLGTARNRCI